ncbi:MAG: non-ribosomal peptide synthetase, partial [Pyrinomonadaceae bacterium]
MTLHHIISDGWSMEVFIRELSALYQAFLRGAPSPLARLPIQYADFAEWQRRWLSGEVLAGQLAYWRGQLAGAPALLELPTDHPRPAVQSFRGATAAFGLDRALTHGLKALSQRAGVTLVMTLLGAFVTFLSRYSGQEDISVGSVIANRTRAEVEGLIGFFINTLVLRTDLSGDPSFRDLLERVREVCLGAYAHQHLPFEYLVDELGPERTLSHAPLFQVAFQLENTREEAVELTGLTATPVEVERETAKFDLTLSMVERADGLAGALEYSTDLFDEATISRMLGHYQTLLEGVTANPDQRISELPLLSEPERNLLLTRWNETRTDYPQDKCVHELFEAQVERRPEAISLVFESEQLTYQELNWRANQLAHHLRTLGVRPEVRVGLYIERSLELVIGILGVLKAGAAYVPLDPSYPPERLTFMLVDAQVSMLLTQARLVERLSLARGAQVIRLDIDWEVIAQESGENPISGAVLENLAYVIYTSGSTGKPKGVLLQHIGLSNLVNAQTQSFNIEADCHVLQFASSSFDASVSEIFIALLTGATLYLARQDTLASIPDLLQLLRHQAITTVTLPPSVLGILPAEGLPGLRTLISAGEACSPEIVASWAPGRRFFNAYGPTEATIGPALYPVECLSETATNVPIGRP